MFCPNCASENSQEQRFCRKCGLHLQTIAQVVAHQVNASKTQQAVDRFSEPRTVWQNPLLYGFILVLLGLTINIIGSVLHEQSTKDIGTIVSVVGSLFFVIRAIFFFQRARFSQPTTTELRKADTTSELPHLLEAKEQPPSITEFTTRHFDPVYAERHEAETRDRRTSDS